MQSRIMKLLVYSSDKEQRQRLLNAIEALTSHFTLETFGDLRSLDFRLRREFTRDIWIVLITINKKELDRLVAMNELIRNNRNILVLPNRDIQTVAVGHRLYPRLISHLNSDFSDIGLVLEKVIRKIIMENQ